MTRVASLEASLSLNSASFESGAERARRAMAQTQASIARDVGQIESRFAQATGAVVAFTKGFAAVALGAGAFAVGTAVVRKMVDEVTAAETATKRLEAVLKATGNTTGTTAARIDDLANAIESSTMATAEGVKEAATRLATFGNVSGKVFEDTLRLSQDVVSVFGGDLPGAAETLGRALEDPSEQISKLVRMVPGFSAAAAESAKKLDEMGQSAQAQSLILAELQRIVGGAGQGEADGLGGAFKHLGDSVGNFLERLDGVTKTTESIKLAVEASTKAIDGMLQPVDALTKQVVEQQQRLVDLREAYDAIKDADGSFALRQTRDELKATIAETETAVASLLALQQAQAAAMRRSQEQIAGGLPSDAGLELPPLRPLLGSAPGGMGAGTAADAIQAEAAAARAAEAWNAAQKARQAAAAEARREEARAADAFRADQMARADAIFATTDAEIAAEKEAVEEKLKIADREAEERKKITERAADAERQLMLEPFLEAARSMTRVFSDAFYEILTTGEISFKSLAESAKNIFARSISDALSAQITSSLQSSMGSTLGNLTGAGGGSSGFGSILTTSGSMFSQGGMFGAPGFQMAANGAGGFTMLPANAGMMGTLGSALGPAAIGFAGGSLLSGMLGMNSTGGGIGGGLGAGIGMMVGGPIGAILGGLGGTLIGGMFGNKPSDRTQVTGYDFVTGSSYQDGQTGEKFSAQNRQIADQVAQQIATYGQELAKKYGEEIKTSFEVRAGDRDGLRFKFGGDEIKAFKDQAELLSYAMKRIEGNFGTAAERATLLADAERKLAEARKQDAQETAAATVRDYKDRLNTNPLKDMLKDYYAITAQIAAARAAGLRGDELQPLKDIRDQVVAMSREDFLASYGYGAKTGLAGAIAKIEEDFRLARRSLERISASTEGLDQAKTKAIADTIAEFVGGFAVQGSAVDEFRKRIQEIDDAIKQVQDVGGNAGSIRDARRQTIEQFAKGIEDQFKSLTPTEQLRESVRQIQEAARAVAELGGSAAGLNALAKDVVDQFAKGVVEQYDRKTPAEQLRDQIAEIDRAIRAVAELGGSTAELARVRRELVQDWAKDIADSFRITGPLDQAREALKTIDAAIAAVRDLGGSAQDLLKVRREYLNNQVDQLASSYRPDDPTARLRETVTNLRGLRELGAGNATQAIKDVLAGFVDSVSAPFLKLDASDNLTRTLEQLDAAIAAVRELGGNEAKLVEARRQAASAAVEAAQAELKSAQDRKQALVEQERSFVQSLSNPLRQSIQSIRVGALSTSSARDQLAILRDRYQSMLQGARADRVTDIQGVGSAAQEYLQALRTYGASGSSYQEAYRSIMAALQPILAKQDARERSIPDAIDQTAERQIKAIRDQRDAVVDEIKVLTREVRELKDLTRRRAA